MSNQVTKLLDALHEAEQAVGTAEFEAKSEAFLVANEEWARIERLLCAEVLAVAAQIDEDNQQRLIRALTRFVTVREE